MIKTFFEIMFAILKFFFPLIAAVLVLVAVFFILCFGWMFYFKKQGLKIQNTPHKAEKRKPLLYQLFVQVPRRYFLDIFEKEEDFFEPCGIHLYCGDQGCGKTIASVEEILRIQKEYPKALCTTNFGYIHENTPLDEWQQLITYCNGKKGVIVGIDEIQNWFMSGKVQLPPQMLEVVTQNRKNRRIIICTAQRISKVNKSIRQQLSMVYEPHTFLGCFTIVVMKKPFINTDGDIEKMKYRGVYAFVHTDELRAAYDTYKVIHTLAKDGFKDPLPEVVVNVTT